MAPSCPMVKVNRGLKLCGFGIPGQMFYSMHVPMEEDEQVQSSTTAVMHIREGVGSVAKATTELRYLINSSWDWQVRKIANGMYEFVAPSKADLDLLIKFTEFQCRSSDLKVCVERSSLATDSFASLSSVWVRASGFPQWARKEKVVEEVAFLIGDPEEVDKQSLIGRGQARVKVQCKHPGEISGSSEVFLNGFGYKIT